MVALRGVFGVFGLSSVDFLGVDGALDFGRPFGVVLSRVRDSDDTVALNFFVFAEMLGVVEREASGVLVDDDRGPLCVNDIGRASLLAPCVGGADMMSGYRTRFEGLEWNITCTIFRVL